MPPNIKYMQDIFGFEIFEVRLLIQYSLCMF